MEQLLLQQLLKKNLLQEKYSLLFLYLFACAKEGHLSAYIDTQSISPSFQEIGQKEGFFQEAVLQSIASSFPQTPPSLAPTQAICRSGNFFYLQRFFVEEKKLVEALDIHIQSWQGSKIDPKILENQLKREQVYLTEEQKQAIFQGCTQPFFLLTGGPGTGKTYTAFQIIYRLWKSGAKKRILFLADRTSLIDQTARGDFRHFKDAMTIIKHKQWSLRYYV